MEVKDIEIVSHVNLTLLKNFYTGRVMSIDNSIGLKTGRNLFTD